MGKFFLTGETVRVNFPDGEYCEIKEELTQADQDYIMTRLMQGRVPVDGDKKGPGTGEKKGLEIGLSFGKLATLERAITGWSFKADDGSPVPVTPENISNLRAKYRALILQEIDRLSSAHGEFAKN